MLMIKHVSKKRGLGRSLLRLLSWTCLLVCAHVSAHAASAQKDSVTLNLKNVTLESFIETMKNETGRDFLYDPNLFSGHRTISVTAQNEPWERLLRRVLATEGFTYDLKNNVVVIRKADAIAAQEEKNLITGTIVDKDDNPLPGVTVIFRGTSVGTATDIDGKFSIARPNNVKELIVTFVGMKTQYVKLENGKTNYDITMQEEVKEMEEVVVTGYQTIDRRQLTSSITSVKAEDILTPGMTSIDQALEGRIPDLIVLNNSGEVGATPRIRVRGTSTLIGNRQPLWVLDGVVLSDPVDVDPSDLNNPDYINIIGNAIAGINPQDIERIDVLKDASATALYGTSAANGVIVVTTKRGSAGRVTLSYSHSSTITRRPRYTDRNINLMNSQERMQFGKDLVDSHYTFPEYMTMVGYEGAYYNWMSGNLTYDQFLDEVQRYETVNTDWFDILTRDAYSHTHTLSFSGGSDQVRYYASFGISKDNGVSKTSYADRYSFLINLDATLSQKFTASISLNANVQNKNHVPSEVDAMNYAYNTTRALPCYNEDGSLYFYQVANSQNTFLNYNILNEINNSSQEYAGTTTMLTMNLRYIITDYWNATLMGSYSRSNTRQEDWWGEESYHVSALRNAEADQTPPTGEEGNCELPYGGILNATQSDNESYSLRLQSNFSKFIDQENEHQIAATLGLELSSNKNTSVTTEQRGYLKDRGKQFVDMSETTSNWGEETTYLIDAYPLFKEWLAAPHYSISENLTNKISGYLTLSYSYRNYFTFNINGRFDASNKFGSESNNRLLPVWSVSGMANLNELFFYDKLMNGDFWITDARLRMSFGQQGNMVDGETPDMLLQQGSIDTYYGEYVSTLYKLPNPNLRWEVTNQTNVALDLALFKSRLNVNLEFYYKKTNDLLSSINVSSVNGTPGGTYTVNNGTLSNTGFSISLSGYPVRTDNFSWYVSTYYSANYNKSETQPVENYTMNDMLDGNAIISGQPVSTFYSYKFMGLDPNTGIPMFDDWEDRVHLLQGKSVADIMMTVLEDSGCRDPFISGNFNNNIKWKNWNLSFNLYYSLGSKVRLFSMYDPIQDGVTSIENIRKEFNERWMVPGDEKRTNYPVLLSPSDPNYAKYRTHWSYNGGRGVNMFAESVWQMYDNSDIRVVSGNYLKLQSLTLRYNFSKELLSKTPFSYASLSFSSQNLFTISAKELKGQDPSQAGFDTPNLSVRPSYTIGLNISF